MWLAGKRILRSASFAALLVAADVDRVLTSQRVKPLELTPVAKCRAAKMAINLDGPAPCAGALWHRADESIAALSQCPKSSHFAMRRYGPRGRGIAGPGAKGAGKVKRSRTRPGVA